jgi:hypothetical protein
MIATVAEKPNGDIYYAQLDEKNNPSNPTLSLLF